MGKIAKLQENTENLAAQIKQLSARCESLKNSNDTLRKHLIQTEAQFARARYDDDMVAVLKERFKLQYFNDFRETAISIFSHENLPEDPIGFFNSKRLESQIFRWGKVCLFPHEYETTGRDGNKQKFKTWYVLPFEGIAGDIDAYVEFPIIKPYSPAGTPLFGRDWGQKTVGVDCVIFTDYFERAQTNANTSMSIKFTTELYSDLLADIEIAKIVNRNWLKVPFLMSPPEDAKANEIKKMASELEDIICGVQMNSRGIMSKYVKNLQLLPTNAQYAGQELEQAKKDYVNDYLNFLGIGHIINENKARKITAEFEKTSDQYNINNIKRLQLREKAFKQAGRIWKEFENVITRVNLTGFATVYDQAAEEAEETENDSKRAS